MFALKLNKFILPIFFIFLSLDNVIADFPENYFIERNVSTEEEFDEAMKIREVSVILLADLTFNYKKRITNTMILNLNNHSIDAQTFDGVGFVVEGKDASAGHLIINGTSEGATNNYLKMSINIYQNDTLEVYGNVIIEGYGLYVSPGQIKLYGYVDDEENDSGIILRGITGSDYQIQAYGYSKVFINEKVSIEGSSNGIYSSCSHITINGTISDPSTKIEGFSIVGVTDIGIQASNKSGILLYGDCKISTGNIGIEIVNSNLDIAGNLNNKGIIINASYDDSIGIKSSEVCQLNITDKVEIVGIKSALLFQKDSFVLINGDEEQPLIIGSGKNENGIILNGANVTVEINAKVSISSSKNAITCDDKSSSVTFKNKLIKFKTVNDLENILEFSSVSKVYLNNPNYKDICKISDTLKFEGADLSISKNYFCNEENLDKVIKNFESESNSSIDAYLDLDLNIKLVSFQIGNKVIDNNVKEILTEVPFDKIEFKISINEITPSSLSPLDNGTYISLTYAKKLFLVKELQLINEATQNVDLIIPYNYLYTTQGKEENYQFIINSFNYLNGIYYIKTTLMVHDIDFIDKEKKINIRKSLIIRKIKVDDIEYDTINEIGYIKDKQINNIFITFDEEITSDRLEVFDSNEYVYTTNANKSTLTVIINKIINDNIIFYIKDKFKFYSKEQYFTSFSLRNLKLVRISPKYLHKNGEVYLTYNTEINKIKNIKLLNFENGKSIKTIDSKDIIKEDKYTYKFKISSIIKVDKAKVKTCFNNEKLNFVDGDNFIYVEFGIDQYKVAMISLSSIFGFLIIIIAAIIIIKLIKKTKGKMDKEEDLIKNVAQEPLSN